jgi:carboxypeptidase D
LIDPAIQFAHYPKFVINNTYGIVAVNQTVLDYMTFALNYPNGCLNQIAACHQISLLAEKIPLLGQKATSAEADNMCNDNVLGIADVPFTPFYLEC